MDLTIMTEYLVIPVAIGCLVIGKVIKDVPLFAKVANAFIPIIVAICGVIFAIGLNWGSIASVSDGFMIAICGAFSGLASTGLYEFFDKFKKVLPKEDI